MKTVLPDQREKSSGAYADSQAIALRDAEPQAHYDALARTFLTGGTQEVLNGFLALLQQQARSAEVTVSRVTVTGMAASEETEARIIVTQWVDLPAEEALAYWSVLGGEIARWAASLAPAQTEIALEVLALDIAWSDRAEAV